MTAVGIDIGGTFTDAVILRDDGSVGTAKTPSTPGRLQEGLLAAISAIAEKENLSLEELLSNVERIAHGTTAATNAFIERRGAKVALLTTRGFEDTMVMQRMMGMSAGLTPSELTDYSLRRVPDPLVSRDLTFGIRERTDYKGDEICPLVEDDVRKAAKKIAESGVEAVAVSYLWSFKNMANEKRTAEILQEELPDVYVSVSSELAPRLGEYERTATTVVNAYLGPMVRTYTDELQTRLGETQLFLLESSGSVMTPREAGNSPVRLLLSGPSGGVTAAGFVGGDMGYKNILTFDMGGTSADVSVITEGQSGQRRDMVVGKFHLLLPMVDIQAIGAGGGSIAGVEEGGYLFVGPESAGAEPGPACYGQGGDLPTVTDADLVLGILDPTRFLGGKLQLDVDMARQAIQKHVAEPLNISVEEAAAAIKRIIDARMADLLRTVTLSRGHDPREFVLFAFGGAGATHAPSFALDVVDEVYVPCSQSVFCGYGAVASDVALKLDHTQPTRLSRDGEGDIDEDEILAIFEKLEVEGNKALGAQNVPAQNRSLKRSVEVCFIRQSKNLTVPYPGSIQQLTADFLAMYAKRYGTEAIPETAGFELVTFVVEAIGSLSRPELAAYESKGDDASAARRGERVVYDMSSGKFVETPVYDGDLLCCDNHFTGPAIVEYEGTTISILSGQQASVDKLLGISIKGVK